MRSVVILAVVSCALAAAAPGCVIEAYDFGQHRGTLTVRWSIDGRRDRASCTTRGASFAHVVVRHDQDGVASDDLFACTAFESSYVLERGWYTVSVALVDASSTLVSEERETSAFYVSSADETFVNVELTSEQPP